MCAKCLAHNINTINWMVVTIIITIIRITLIFLTTWRIKLLDYVTEAEVSPRPL